MTMGKNPIKKAGPQAGFFVMQTRLFLGCVFGSFCGALGSVSSTFGGVTGALGCVGSTFGGVGSSRCRGGNCGRSGRSRCRGLGGGSRGGFVTAGSQTNRQQGGNEQIASHDQKSFEG